MQEYRLYCRGRDGRFFKREDFLASSDGDALRQAPVMRAGFAAELWRGATLIEIFERDQAA